MSTQRLQNKRVIITGAASGVGRCTATLFANAGAKLFLVDINDASLSQLQEELGADAASYCSADVSSEVDTRRYVEAAEKFLGAIDGAVLNAGIPCPAVPLVDCSVEDFDRIMAVNSRGPFLGLKHIIPTMVKAGLQGSIALTASTTAFRGEPGLAPYVASKHAVLGLMRTASIETAPHGIRVNAVSPGAIDTPMTRAGLASTFSSDEDGQRFLDSVAEAIPLKRIATPGDIANTLMFLISDDSAFTTGANYVVDGGATEAPSIW